MAASPHDMIPPRPALTLAQIRARADALEARTSAWRPMLRAIWWEGFFFGAIAGALAFLLVALALTGKMPTP